jgi:hypothetical protein
MFQVRLEKGVEDQTLREGEKIVGQKSVEDDLFLRKWACEEKFDVRRLEDEAALEKSFENRTSDHQQRAANQALGSDQLGESFCVPVMEQDCDEKNERGKADQSCGTAEASQKVQRSPLE